MVKNSMVAAGALNPIPGSVALGTRLNAHLAIARFDHSIKNVFVLPGIAVALSLARIPLNAIFFRHISYGFLSVTLIACSNYVLNEIVDAPSDRFHPTKKMRPAACSLISIPAGYAQWILMMVAGLLLGWLVSWQFTVAAAALWTMGCLYNIPPVRIKDLPYLDVLAESVNNPLRMLLGWYMVTVVLIPPASLLIAYWMVGGYFMALKRFSEYRQINNPSLSTAYRKSFRYYTEPSLLVSVTFYASAAMLFFGAFIMRYRVELVLSFPFVALVMAIYFRLAFEPESAVQNPEKLYREPLLICSILVCLATMILLLFIDLPVMRTVFAPSV
jgi:decaprenyl-phosphate phosphoribosyltransferase